MWLSKWSSFKFSSKKIFIFLLTRFLLFTHNTLLGVQLCYINAPSSCTRRKTCSYSTTTLRLSVLYNCTAIVILLYLQRLWCVYHCSHKVVTEWSVGWLEVIELSFRITMRYSTSNIHHSCPPRQSPIAYYLNLTTIQLENNWTATRIWLENN